MMALQAARAGGPSPRGAYSPRRGACEPGPLARNNRVKRAATVGGRGGRNSSITRPSIYRFS